MPFDDRPADGKPHPHASRLRRKEGIVKLADVMRVDSDTRVLHGHQHLILLMHLRSNPQFLGRSFTVAIA